MRRDDVASTLIRRHFGTKCPRGCWSSTYYHSHTLPEKPFKMSRTPTFSTAEGLSILYLPFVLKIPFSGGKKYLRRAKISVETSETRKRYDTCVIYGHKLLYDTLPKLMLLFLYLCCVDDELVLCLSLE